MTSFHDIFHFSNIHCMLFLSGTWGDSQVWNEKLQKHSSWGIKPVVMARAHCSCKCSLFNCCDIFCLTVSLTNLFWPLPGQSSLWQRCIQDWNHFPDWVPFQASQDHIQDKNLSPQHWWEGPGVLACDQCRELEACHQNWPRWVC